MNTQDENKAASAAMPVVNTSTNNTSEDKTKEAEKVTSTEKKVEEVKAV